MRKSNIPNKGNILLAHPFLTDPNFHRSMILITEHNSQSTTGFILNKTLKVKIHQAITDFPEFESDLFFGGPVEMGILHYLHCRGDRIENAFEVMDGVYWGGDYESVKSSIQNKEITPDEIIFLLGYSGWSYMQLDAEIKQNSWIVTSSNKDEIFLLDKKQLWKNILLDMGGKYSLLAHAPDNPELN